MSKYVLVITLFIIPILAFIDEAISLDKHLCTDGCIGFGSAKNALNKKIKNHFRPSGHNSGHTKESMANVVIETSSNSGTVPLSVTFKPLINNHSGHKPVKYVWNFGDGEVGIGSQATHQFSVPGQYLTRLTITDQNNQDRHYTTTVSAQKPKTKI